jgi:hypothetical protein
MTAFQARNFEAWITSLHIAFSKNFPEIYFLIEKKKVPTEDHTTPSEGRTVAGSLQYPSGY